MSHGHGRRGITKLAAALLCIFTLGQGASRAEAQTSEQLAEAVQRTALINYRIVRQPTPDDHRLLCRLLELAVPLTPEDPELMRRIVSAAWGTSDEQLLHEATGRVVAIDPSDTLAQLRYITHNIETRQTAEERLAIYDRLLGKGGERLDPAIRSRLALDAALLHRDHGEDQKFRDRLRQAIELDETNKDAIAYASGYYAANVSDPLGYFDLQLRMLRADPHDPNIYMLIARLLAGEGALVEAFTFHALGSRLLREAGIDNPKSDVERLAFSWLIKNPGTVIDEIGRRLANDRLAAADLYEAQKAQDVPESELTPPENVHLDPLYERIRLLAGLADINENAVDAALREFQALAQEGFDALSRPEIKADPERYKEAIDNAAIRNIELQFMLAIANRPVREIDTNLARLFQARPDWSRELLLFEAWRLFRSGETEAASDLLDRRGVTSDRDEMLRGYIDEARQDVDAALAHYDQIIRADPLSPLGAWAKSRTLRITRATTVVTPVGKQLVSALVTFPEWIIRSVENPRSFMSLTIEPLNDSENNQRLPKFLIKLTNLAPGPMAVGSDKPINSRLLLDPEILDVPEYIGSPTPIVVELDRRLRLKQRESIEAIVSPALGYNGLLDIASIASGLRHRWRVIQGFELEILTSRGGRQLVGTSISPGPMCLAVETGSLIRPATQNAAMTADQLAQAIRDANGSGRVPTLEAATAALYKAHADKTTTDIEGIVAAAAESYADQSPPARATMLAILPSAASVPAMERFDAAARRALVDAATTGEPADRLSITLTLLTRITDPADPIFDAVIGSSDPTTGEIAQLIRSRLEQGTPTIAVTGPGIKPLAGLKSRQTSALRK